MSRAYEEGPVILTEVINRIGVITMNRPQRMNALNGALSEALFDAVHQMAADDGVKVVVLTGAPRGDAVGGVLLWRRHQGRPSRR